jgi:hypothetical protein
MSNRQDSNTRTIHPRALKELGEEACIVALGVARDLRSGAIPPEKYDQAYYENNTACETACCIAGWMRIRGVFHETLLRANTGNLLGYGIRPTPLRAANAIERYIYDGSETPWNG